MAEHIGGTYPIDSPLIAEHLRHVRIVLAILVNLLAIMWPAFGDERLPALKVGDTTYSNVLVVRVTATDIYFTSANGICNAKLTNLEPALQMHFAPDAVNAGEIEKRQAAANAQYQRALAVQDGLGATPGVAPSAPAAKEIVDADSSTHKKIWAKSYLNQKAPDLVVEKWLTDEPDTRGKWVLIDFWATWCGPCRRAIPELNAFHRRFGDKLAVIGLSDESEADVRMMVDPKIEYSVAIDTQKRMKSAVEVIGIPHVLLIDPQGIVRWEGFPLLSGYELSESVVSAILDKYANTR
jgi:thiol-disulfide isomerase/thioredoxin